MAALSKRKKFAREKVDSNTAYAIDEALGLVERRSAIAKQEGAVILAQHVASLKDDDLYSDHVARRSTAFIALPDERRSTVGHAEGL